MIFHIKVANASRKWDGTGLFNEINIDHKPLPEKVSEEIEKLIVSGTFKPGDKLPSESELAQRIGVGRSTVREAIKYLMSRNILEVHRGNGTFVCQNTGLSEDPLGLRFISNKKKLGLDLCEIRLMIEPNMAMLAAKNATQQEIEKMQELCETIQDQIRKGEDYGKKDQELHILLATCTHNCVIPHLVPILCESIPFFMNITKLSVKMETIQTHQAVVDAVRARDPQMAYKAMQQHIMDNKRSIEALPDDI